jgi:hypothetical protein
MSVELFTKITMFRDRFSAEDIRAALSLNNTNLAFPIVALTHTGSPHSVPDETTGLLHHLRVIGLSFLL